MTASAPSYAQDVFAHAIRVLGDPAATPFDREHAAAVARFASKHVELNEPLASDLMSVAARWLADAKVVAPLLRILEVRSSREVETRLAAGIERLAARAHEERLGASLLAIVTVMRDRREWRSRVQPAWLVRALEYATADRRNHLGAASLLYGCAQERGPLAPELRELIEHNPAPLGSLSGAPWQAWRLHCAAPTVRGWRLLAAKPSCADDVPAAASFGSELDVAIETLEQAVGEQPKGATRVVLARWLVELQGHAGEATS